MFDQSEDPNLSIAFVMLFFVELQTVLTKLDCNQIVLLCHFARRVAFVYI